MPPSRSGTDRTRRPGDFAEVLSLARTDDMVKTIALAPDPQRHLDLIASYAGAEFTQILIHQIGPGQDVSCGCTRRN